MTHIMRIKSMVLSCEELCLRPDLIIAIDNTFTDLLARRLDCLMMALLLV